MSKGELNCRFFDLPIVHVQQRPPLRGPTFIRLLARLADVDVTPPSPSLPDRLSRWLDWNQALALATALDDRPVVADTDAPPSAGGEEACTRARGVMAAAIRDEPILNTSGFNTAGSSMTGPDAAGLAGDGADASVDYDAFRQCYLARQRAMHTATGRLRGDLRDALAQTSTEMARLAAVDAVMEQALSPREHALLATVPDLLGRRFARMREAAPASHAWLDGFRRDMQGVLLAELDLRFQPVEALLAALRTP